MQNIFLVEDDININELLSYALKSNDFNVVGFESSDGFWDRLEKELPDLIILDIMLPNQNGIEILKKIKDSEKTKQIPVIMLTARAEEIDKLTCFENGADDYLVKPFSVLELIARIKARLKNSVKKEEHSLLKFNEISIDVSKREVNVNNSNIELTFKEFELLTYLINNNNLVLTRNQILQSIWGYDFEGESRTVDMHIKTLRQKLLDSGKYIKTIRSVGYMLGE